MTNKPAPKKRGSKFASMELHSTAKRDDISRILGSIVKWEKQPRVTDDDDCQRRLESFFQTCINTGEIPTVEKMAYAVGYDRRTIWEWRAKKTKGERRAAMMEMAMEAIAAFEAEMAMEGLVHHAVYSFRAKNYFGMKDQMEHVLTPNNPLGDMQDKDELRARITEGVKREKD